MKTAISIPDQTFKEAEKTAKRLKLSRSELYRRALEAFLRVQRDRGVTESYDEAFSSPESDAEKRFRRRAARDALSNIEWNE